MINKNNQQGAVLLVAIVMLLVISILGISAVKSSNNKTQVAGNSISSMLVYQGAESTLAKTASDTNWFNLDNAMNSPTESYTMLAVDLPDENVNSGGILNSTSVTNFQGLMECPPTSNLATSSIMDCFIFDINANSRLRATNARDWHVKGTAVVSP